MEFFSSMDPFLKGFWFIAIPVTLIFLVQTIMTFIGVDATDGIEADFDGDFEPQDAPFQVFSLRNLVNFLLGFSWTGIAFHNLIESKVLLILLAMVIGCVFVYLFFLVIRILMRLSENNSFKINDVVNKTAEVYIPIPEQKRGKGKVMVSVKGSVHELEAMTEGQRIASSTIVKIVKVEENILFVEAL